MRKKNNPLQKLVTISFSALKVNIREKTYGEQKPSKKMWKTVKDICESLGKDRSCGKLANIAATVKESLKLCNSHFATVAVTLAGPILVLRLSVSQSSLTGSFIPNKTTTNSFFIMPTDIDEVDRLLMQLKSGTAAGYDACKPLLVKQIENVILEPLTYNIISVS